MQSVPFLKLNTYAKVGFKWEYSVKIPDFDRCDFETHIFARNFNS